MKMKVSNSLGAMFLLMFLTVALVAGCFRGEPKQEPPIHLNPNMFKQAEIQAAVGKRVFPRRRDHAATGSRHSPRRRIARGQCLLPWQRRARQSDGKVAGPVDDAAVEARTRTIQYLLRALSWTNW